VARPAQRFPVILPMDHLDPHGVGGEATVGNIQLLCRAHNAYESELFYRHGRRSERRTLPGKSQPRPTTAVTSRGEATTT